MEPPLPKSAYGPGPWQDEPDEYRWTHAGLACYIYRHFPVTGSLNGYVAVPDTHPWWGKDYHECIAIPSCDADPPIDYTAERRWSCSHRIEHLLEVHGGVTYGGPMSTISEEAETFAWGFGFDTGHAGDVTPAMDATIQALYSPLEWAEHQRIMTSGPFGSTYKTFAYVKAETERLAEQLAIANSMGWRALLMEDDGERDAAADSGDSPHEGAGILW
jgi:hypothetical protein